MPLTKSDYIQLKLTNRLDEILWRRFLEITNGSLGIPRELFIAKIESVAEDLPEGGPMRMTKLQSDVIHYYETLFELTWISHKNEYVFAGNREDMFITAPY